MERRQRIKGCAKNTTHRGRPVDYVGGSGNSVKMPLRGLAWEARFPVSPLTEILDLRDTATAGRENELDL